MNPQDTRSLSETPGLVSEATRLACRYLDLAVLWRIGFTGHVMDRTDVTGWAGDTQVAGRRRLA